METRDALLELRRDLGLSQEEFAQKLCVTRQAVSRWETGETVPSTDTLKEIAKVFQVSVDRLLGYPAGYCQSCGMALTRDEERQSRNVSQSKKTGRPVGRPAVFGTIRSHPQ